MKTFYSAIASSLLARQNCEKTGNRVWFVNHTETIERMVKEHAPSGSGFDAGTTLDFDQSTPERLVFNTSFHHMDDNGSYCGWSEHKVIVKASLWAGVDIRVTGKDRRGIKEYISDQFTGLDVSLPND